MDVFPQILYHETEAKDGKLFRTEDDLPADMQGWVDTPAKFDPNYVEPPASDIEEVGEDAAARGFVLIEYPAIVYKKGEPESGRLVKTAEAYAELDAAEPGVWKGNWDPKSADWDPKHPANAQKAEAPATDDAPPAPKSKAKKGTKATAAPAPATAAPLTAQTVVPTDGVALTADQIAAFRKASIADIAAQLEAVSNVAALDALAASEAENPKKRASVVKAIKARRAALSAGGEE